MPYYITELCVDVLDRSCIRECPVDCIYERGMIGIDHHHHPYIAALPARAVE